MKTQEEQRTLIRVDKIAIKRTKEAMQNRVDLLNEFVEVSENCLKAKFNKKDKIDLKDQGVSFALRWLKPKFKFPDADEAFNLQALGIDMTPVQGYWDASHKHWKDINVELDDDKFIIRSMDDLPEVKRHYHYAKNERQEKAYGDAMEVCKALNELLDKGFIMGIPKDLCKGFTYVRYGTETNTYDPKLPIKFFPNEMGILKM